VIAHLIDKKTQACTKGELDYLEKVLRENQGGAKDSARGGLAWFLSSILTDRGTEMLDAEGFELSCFYDPTTDSDILIRCPVFYCDPYSSWQKPHIEEVHTLIRRVLKKGTSFDDLCQEQIDLLCSHVNSYARKSLGGTSPFDNMPPGFSDELMRALGMSRINPDDIILTPGLLL